MIKFKPLKKKFRYTNTIRISFQLIILLLLLYVGFRPYLDDTYFSDFEAYCPFGGLSALLSKMNLGSLSCQMGETQIFLGVTLLLAAIVFGKLFCSYLCPIGSISEWLGKIGEKFHLRFNLPNFLDRGFRVLKYALLYFSLYYTMTSSELFCKTFDPFFAVVTGFDNNDLVLYYAIPALVITILGSIFFRLFWCKYLCPLGAITNIFNNFLPSLAVIIVYAIANLLGANLDLLWLVVALILIGAITEIIFMRAFGVALPKIKREESSCTMCGVCDDKCPEGIKVSEYKTVNHVDCHLCTDCVYACPVKNTLTISGKNSTKYLAPIVVILLIAASLIFSSYFELATLSEKWGNHEKVANLEIFETNVKSIKCFGSASSFRNQISSVQGVYGLDAFATSHDVNIYYNPDEISLRKLKEAIFNPTKQLIIPIDKLKADSISVVELHIDKLFDNIDQTNLTYTLFESKAVYGYETLFGEPIIAKIYFDEKTINISKIVEAIEKDEVKIKLRDGSQTIREMNFSVEGEPKLLGKISKNNLQKVLFKEYDMQFNGYKKADKSKIEVFIFTMQDAAQSKLAPRLPYLTSHLSNWKGIKRFSTRHYEVPTGLLFFDETITSLDSVKIAVESKTLKVHFKDGSVKEVPNPFKIKAVGEVKKFSEIKID